MSELAISVIVATRDRLASMQGLLETLAPLAPSLEWELVVVDNGSRDGSLAWLERQHFAKPLAVLSQPVPGKSRALNLGIAHARGALLVFTDDDVAPDAAWLDRLADAAARYPSANVFGGRILPVYDSVPAWIRNSQNLQEMLLSEHDLGEAERSYPPYRYPIGPNMAVRAASVARTGAHWPEDRGPGTRLPLGDERGFLQGVSEATAEDRIYVPAAVVHHVPETEQLTFRAASRRCFQGGYVAGRLDRATARQIAVSAEVRGRVAARLRVSSLAEFGCMLSRAAGVAAGRIARDTNAR